MPSRTSMPASPSGSHTAAADASVQPPAWSRRNRTRSASATARNSSRRPRVGCAGEPEGPGAACQQRRTPLHPPQHRPGPEEGHPRGSELNRQWEPVQTSTDLGDLRGVILGDSEVGVDGGRTIGEQPHGRCGSTSLRCSDRYQAWAAVPPAPTAPPQMQRPPARHDDLRSRRDRQQTWDLAGGVEHLLEVVEDEQYLPFPQVVLEDLVHRTLPPFLPQPERGAMVGTTSTGSETDDRSTKNTPSGNSAAAAAATCTPSRVLPVPPEPVSVMSRFSARSALARAISSSRPTNEVSGVGRLTGTSRLRTGGNSEEALDHQVE